MLVLPPEATGSQRSVGLDHRNIDARPCESSRLGSPNGLNVVAVDGLYEAIADGVEGGAESPDVLIGDDVQGLRDGGRDGTEVESAIGSACSAVRVRSRRQKFPGPEFPGLAAAADNRLTVALKAQPLSL